MIKWLGRLLFGHSTVVRALGELVVAICFGSIFGLIGAQLDPGLHSLGIYGMLPVFGFLASAIASWVLLHRQLNRLLPKEQEFIRRQLINKGLLLVAMLDEQGERLPELHRNRGRFFLGQLKPRPIAARLVRLPDVFVELCKRMNLEGYTSAFRLAMALWKWAVVIAAISCGLIVEPSIPISFGVLAMIFVGLTFEQTHRATVKDILREELAPTEELRAWAEDDRAADAVPTQQPTHTPHSTQDLTASSATESQSQHGVLDDEE